MVAAILVLSIAAFDIHFFISGQEEDTTAGSVIAHVVAAIAVIYIAIAGIIIANTWCKKK